MEDDLKMTISIWKMTVSILKMTVSIWDILSLCLRVAGEEDLLEREAELCARGRRRAAREGASPVVLARVYQYHDVAQLGEVAGEHCIRLHVHDVAAQVEIESNI